MRGQVLGQRDEVRQSREIYRDRPIGGVDEVPVGLVDVGAIRADLVPDGIRLADELRPELVHRGDLRVVGSGQDRGGQGSCDQGASQ